MSIDFFTFFAQIFNLLLLLYLLRRFLYLPVLKAVDERQKFIERELKKAALSHKAALQMEAECKQKMAEIDTQKQEILAQTRQEALAKLKEKIESLPVRKKQEFAAAYQNKKQLIIRSAQKILPEQKQIIKEFLQGQFELAEETKFKFEIDKKLVCGVALQADEQLIEWNLAAYLAEFQKNMENDVQQLVNKG